MTKQTDYSCELPRIIAKLTAISESLYYAANETDGYEYQELMKGFSYSLEEIRDEVEKINRALYWNDDETALKPDTAAAKFKHV